MTSSPISTGSASAFETIFGVPASDTPAGPGASPASSAAAAGGSPSSFFSSSAGAAAASPPPYKEASAGASGDSGASG